MHDIQDIIPSHSLCVHLDSDILVSSRNFRPISDAQITTVDSLQSNCLLMDTNCNINQHY